MLVIVLLGVVLGTKVVSDDDQLAQVDEDFDAEEFGAENFPEVQDAIISDAVGAEELASAIDADPDDATNTYAEAGSGEPVFSVTLTGVAGEEQSGIYDVDVDGVPDDLGVRVQTGPAINGTELRDATGTMPFGNFDNQIDYQDSAAALNEEMKQAVLADADTDDLEGETVSLTGAFTLVNPETWLITPVEFEVQ